VNELLVSGGIEVLTLVRQYVLLVYLCYLEGVSLCGGARVLSMI